MPQQAYPNKATKPGKKSPKPTTLMTKCKKEHPHVSVGLNKTAQTKEMQKSQPDELTMLKTTCKTPIPNPTEAAPSHNDLHRPKSKPFPKKGNENNDAKLTKSKENNRAAILRATSTTLRNQRQQKKGRYY